MSSEWWRYENLEPCKEGQGWELGTSQSHPDDFTDFHIDLGCGKIPKARLGIDRNQGDICMNLNTGEFYESTGNPEELNLTNPDEGEHAKAKNGILPFPNESIESIISHHCLEHIGDGFIDLMDDVYRVLKPGGLFRIIVPMFPSFAAFEDQDHKRLFGPDSFLSFTGREEQVHWHESFAEPYTKARFEMTACDYTPAPTIEYVDGKLLFWDQDGSVKEIYQISTDELMPKSRELRVSLRK